MHGIWISRSETTTALIAMPCSRLSNPIVETQRGEGRSDYPVADCRHADTGEHRSAASFIQGDELDYSQSLQMEVGIKTRAWYYRACHFLVIYPTKPDKSHLMTWYFRCRNDASGPKKPKAEEKNKKLRKTNARKKSHCRWLHVALTLNAPVHYDAAGPCSSPARA